MHRKKHASANWQHIHIFIEGIYQMLLHFFPKRLTVIHTYIHWWRPLSHSCPIQICKLTNLVIVTDQLWRMPLFTSCAATSVSFSPVSKCTLLCGDTVWVSRKKNMSVIFFILPCLINGNWTNYYTTFYCTFVFDVYNTL